MFCTVAEAAAVLRTHPGRVHQLIKAGKLRANRDLGPRSTRIEVDSLPIPENEQRQLVATLLAKVVK